MTGRHSDLDAKRENLITLARTGMPNKLIAERCRMHPDHLSRWLKFGDDKWIPKDTDECPKDREPYRQFRHDFFEAKAGPAAVAEATWIQAIRGRPAIPADKKEGIPAQPAIPPDWKAAHQWLKLHHPELYRETVEVELGGSLGSALDAAMRSIEAMIEAARSQREIEDGDAS